MTFAPNLSAGAFLPINQTYSEDAGQFLIQITNRDRDVARFMNIREIGIYDLTQVMNGQNWFTPGNQQIKRFGFRQVYEFTTVGNITHNISGITQVIASGQYTDGTNFYGLIYASSVAIAGQVTCFVTPTVITIKAGAGAPAFTSGVVVLDYLLN